MQAAKVAAGANSLESFAQFFSIIFQSICFLLEVFGGQVAEHLIICCF